LGLVSPFLLQDTLSRNLKDSKPPTAISSPKLIFKSSNVSAKPLRANIMSHASEYASRKGKERESGNTRVHSSHSRRSRTSSTPSMSRTPSPLPNIDTAPLSGSNAGGSSLRVPQVSVISPTPDISPVTPSRRPHHKSQPTIPTISVLQRPITPPAIGQQSSGKRKAEEADVGGDKTPPKDPKEQRATFAPDPRTHRTSSSSHAPSSYNRSKRVRLTQSFDARSASRSNSHAGSVDHSPPNAKSTGSWSSRGSRGPRSATSHGHLATSSSHHSHSNVDPQTQTHRPSSRRSLSQASIPLSALVSPHAPSVGRSGSYHMRDPRKPAPIQSTNWSLTFPSQVQEGEARWGWRGWVERGGSPLHAWLFFIGFVLFPLWWVAAFIPVRRTRRLGGTDAEKGVVLDDPQLEHDAKSWRRRCRIMAGVSLVTYIPFIVLVAIFA